MLCLILVHIPPFALDIYHVRDVKKVNLLNLGPLNSYSSLTFNLSLPSILAGLISYFTNFVLPDRPNFLNGSFVLGVNFLLASGSFLIPLWGMHQRLIGEKARMAEENNHRLTELYKKFYKLLDADQHRKAAELKSGISTLLEFRTLISSTSTWPWETETIRGFISALFIPIGIWLMQQVIERLLII